MSGTNGTNDTDNPAYPVYPAYTAYTAYTAFNNIFTIFVAVATTAFLFLVTTDTSAFTLATTARIYCTGSRTLFTFGSSLVEST